MTPSCGIEFGVGQSSVDQHILRTCHIQGTEQTDIKLFMGGICCHTQDLLIVCFITQSYGMDLEDNATVGLKNSHIFTIREEKESKLEKK